MFLNPCHAIAPIAKANNIELRKEATTEPFFSPYVNTALGLNRNNRKAKKANNKPEISPIL